MDLPANQHEEFYFEQPIPIDSSSRPSSVYLASNMFRPDRSEVNFHSWPTERHAFPSPATHLGIRGRAISAPQPAISRHVASLTLREEGLTIPPHSMTRTEDLGEEPPSEPLWGQGIDEEEDMTGSNSYIPRYYEEAVIISSPVQERFTTEAESSTRGRFSLPRPFTPEIHETHFDHIGQAYIPPRHDQRPESPWGASSRDIGRCGSPDSLTSPSNRYAPYNAQYSRSASTGTSPHRSTSPALSNASTSRTSLSSQGSSRLIRSTGADEQDDNASPGKKHRKQRLFSVDRKAICEYHRDNPKATQEDIASRYGVERSTISKVLKHKSRWLAVPENETARVAKFRPSKFPAVEEKLLQWLISIHGLDDPSTVPEEPMPTLTDALLRSKAREVAYEMLISEDQFKASSGWVENFKHRMGIRRGVWQSRDKALQSTSLSAESQEVKVSPATPEESHRNEDTFITDSVEVLKPELDISLDPNRRPPIPRSQSGGQASLHSEGPQPGTQIWPPISLPDSSPSTAHPEHAFSLPISESLSTYPADLLQSSHMDIDALGMSSPNPSDQPQRPMYLMQEVPVTPTRTYNREAFIRGASEATHALGTVMRFMQSQPADRFTQEEHRVLASLQQRIKATVDAEKRVSGTGA